MDKKISRRDFIKITGGTAATLLVGSAAITAGCIDPEFEEKETREIKDMWGRNLDIPKDTERLVATSAGALRLTSYLKAGDKVVGVEENEQADIERPYQMANPQYQEVPTIGPQHSGDAEKILGVNPDVVLTTYNSDIDPENLQESIGIPVVVVEYGEILTKEKRQIIYEALRTYGKVLNKTDRAEEVIDIFKDRIDDLERRGEEVEDAPRMYVGGIGRRGQQGLRSTVPDYAPLELLGYENMEGQLKGIDELGEVVEVDREKLIEYDPEIIFIDGGDPHLSLEELEKPEYQNLTAVENNEIYKLTAYNSYTTQYENVLINSYMVGKYFSPEQFNDIDIKDISNEIYKDIYGEPVYSDMVERHGEFGEIEV
ncbi:ABC transporter substrate-binding protein [Methanonatronarchaeum thermophilum]|nr:ABC transporter substrate-binding protein [Methanonatronarchaeum thermophilum]